MSTTTDEPTAFVSAYDDILQMIASVEHLDRGDTEMAAELASGLDPARQVFALTNITRVLVNLLQNERTDASVNIYDDVRESIIAQIAGDPTD